MFDQAAEPGFDVGGADEEGRLEAVQGELLDVGCVVVRYLDAELVGGAAVAGEFDSRRPGYLC